MNNTTIKGINMDKLHINQYIALILKTIIILLKTNSNINNNNIKDSKQTQRNVSNAKREQYIVKQGIGSIIYAETLQKMK